MSTQVYTDTETTRKEINSETTPKGIRWTGRILSGLIILFMLMDAGMKLIIPTPAFVVEGSAKIGYPAAPLFGIGLVLLISTILYAIPRTSVLGAILLTGYLGGAVSTHVRVQDGAFNILFPVIFGIIVWAGLYLRDSRMRDLIPYRR